MLDGTKTISTDKFTSSFQGRRNTESFQILNRESLSDLPIKEKVPLEGGKNLDLGLIFFLTFFYWQIALRSVVQDLK